MTKHPDEAAAGMRRFILNADDYAMDAAVDTAILELAAQGVITATSAMVLYPAWPEAGKNLRDAPLNCGLHLDFTSPFAAPYKPATLLTLMLRAYSGRLSRQALRTAIHRQLDLYDTVMGRAPDFIDGHQHVHQFPMIREEMLHALDERYGSAATAIALRSCMPRRWRGLKAAVVAATGAAGLAKLARAGGFRTNSDFAGVYDFAPQANFATLWRRWLGGLQGEAPLIMCHVAVAAGDPPGGDPIRMARLAEFAWLTSSAFNDLTEELAAAPGFWPNEHSLGTKSTTSVKNGAHPIT